MVLSLIGGLARVILFSLGSQIGVVVGLRSPIGIITGILLIILGILLANESKNSSKNEKQTATSLDKAITALALIIGLAGIIYRAYRLIAAMPYFKWPSDLIISLPIELPSLLIDVFVLMLGISLVRETKKSSVAKKELRVSKNKAIICIICGIVTMLFVLLGRFMLIYNIFCRNTYDYKMGCDIAGMMSSVSIFIFGVMLLIIGIIWLIIASKPSKQAISNSRKIQKTKGKNKHE